MSIRRLVMRMSSLGALAMFACVAPGCDEASDARPDAGHATDVAGGDAALSSDHDPGMSYASAATPRRQVLATFSGYGDTATGEVVIEMVEPVVSEGGLRGVQQASWCDAVVEQDGVEGTGSPDTVELFTIDGSIASSLPGEPTAAGCIDDELALTRPQYDDLYLIDGVFCAEVGIRSFYDGPLSDVHADIRYTREAANAPWQYPYGNGADVSDLPGRNAPTAADGGVFRFGSLGAADSGLESTTTLWTFKNQGDGAFEFSGEIAYYVEEICGNDIDDDCDGVVDNGCRLFAADEPCFEDSDCVSESCLGGVCEAGCGPGSFGVDCDPCPGGALNPCSGNGTCNDGVDGDGLCECATGYVGAACDGCDVDYYGATPVLVISDYLTADEALATALTNAGFAVTRRTAAFDDDTDTTDFGNLDGFATVFWSATGAGFGSEHSRETFAALEDYADDGDYVMVVGYDTIASPTDDQLITFLGGTSSIDSGISAAIENVDNVLTTGEQDVRGLTPSGLSFDRDRLTGLADDVVAVQGDAAGASITLRPFGAGYIAYLSNGNSGTTSTSSWTTEAADGSGVANAIVRNYASNAGAAWSGNAGCAACDCGDGACDDGIDGDGTCICPAGFAGVGCTECEEGRYGAACDPCPLCGVNGTCDDGIDGEGVCICDEGFHGATCGASCEDGLLNGDEDAVDCGGSCAAATGSSDIAFSLRTEPGNTLTLGDDDVSAALPIGFTFTYFGTDYTEAYVSSNGFLTFSDQGSGCCSGQSFPSVSSPNGVIALYWSDLNPTDGGTIRYGTQGIAPNREFVVSFTDVPHFGGDPGVTGQIILRESGEVQIHCASCLSDGGTITQGIENLDGTDAYTPAGRNAADFEVTNGAMGARTTGCPVGDSGDVCAADIDCAIGLGCDGGTCDCATGFTGAACDACEAGYFGASCEACPGGAASPCGGNGTCDDGIGGAGTCACDAGFFGPDCSLAYFEDFAANAGDFTVSGWSWSSGAIRNLSYGTNVLDTATSPVLDCGDEATDMTVEFSLTGATEACCDDVDLQRSFDGGGTWTTVQTWRGTMPGDVSVTIPGSAGEGSTVIRLLLDSDGSVSASGPILDDFGTSCPVQAGPVYVYDEDFADADHGAALDGWTVSGGSASYLSYPNNADDSLHLPMFDCTDAGSDMSMEFALTGTTENAFDYVRVERSIDGGSTWTAIANYTGSMPGTVTLAMPSTAGEGDVRVRFRLDTDSSVSSAGPVLDDVRSTCNTGPRPPVATEDFADGDHGITFTGSWAVSSGALRNAYGNNALDYATFPAFDCTAEIYDPQITFDLAGSTESGWDDLFVQTSIDGGGTWTTQSEYTGSFDGSQRLIDISGAAGEGDVRVRFFLDSDSSVTTSGPVIDDFGITCEGAPEPPAWEEDFADGAGDWDLTGWSVASETVRYPSYPNSINHSAVSPTFDCSGEASNMVLDFDLTGSTESCCDTVYLERSVDGGSTWASVNSWRGTMPGAGQSATLAGSAGQDDVVFRFRLQTDGSVNSAGPVIDNFEATCEAAAVPPPYEQDFAAGAGDWTLGGWTASGGDLNHLSYANNLDDSTVSPTFDCSGEAADMVLGFDLTGTTETNFDYVRLERSLDGGSTWSTLNSYTGTMPGVGQSVTITSSAGEADVLVRFRLDTDSSVSSAGPRLDNITATCDLAPEAAPYEDDFAGGAAGWDLTGWAASGGDVNYLLYPNSIDRSAISPTFDCSGEASDMTFSFDLTGSTESGFDNVRFERSIDGGSSWTLVQNYTGSMPGAGQSLTIPGSAGQDDVVVRFRLTTDGSVNSAGPRFDNVSSTCGAAAAGSYSQNFDAGLGDWTATGWSISGGALSYLSYPNSIDHAAVTPVLDCSGEASNMDVTFNLTGMTETNFDYVRMDRSLDGGSTWATVQSWTGSMPGAQAITIASSAGDDNVRIRFRLDTDSSVSSSGPILDDFTATCGAAL